MLQRASKEEEEVKSTQYRPIVEKWMYYIAKVAPEIANAVQELAEQMIKPMAEHDWKALDRAVEYILNEPYKGLILKRPTKNFKSNLC